eukprot:gnl/TRDRNA2_/TRDRNA2_87075_c0_seq1.p1 gnl/TRDRNA2_/TRDRNA2_87075_c0~~gnl/TRDRNA2_/TRDRNA2_87075_c0_seq1.p1  ORF type:complete len:518 (-),score=46.09 gnl/TRDRNA2_/TRDRNA2_87075_c0_seq1:183-1736(-)
MSRRPVSQGASPLQWQLSFDRLPLPVPPLRDDPACSSLGLYKDKFIISDGQHIVRVDPRSGSADLVADTTPAFCKITSMHPTTGEFVLSRFATREALASYDDWESRAFAPSSFARLDVETGVLSTITIEQEHVYRVDFISGNEKVLTSITLAGGLLFEHVSNTGEVIASAQRKPGRGKSGWPSPPIVRPDYGVFIFLHTCILMWPLKGDWETVAGRLSVAGTKDGIGCRALFTHLMRPWNCQASAFLLVREASAEPGRSRRLVRVDLSTDEVCTVDVRGLDMSLPTSRLLTCCVGNRILCWHRPQPDGSCDLHHGQLIRVGVQTSLAVDLQGLDLTESIRPLVFLLASGERLHVDGRVLGLRSAYFQRMLASGCREASTGEVDLRNDPDVRFAALSDLLRYIISDVFEPTIDSTEHMLCVRGLADRYQLAHLLALVEERLVREVVPANVLSFLGRIIGSCGVLEQACWKMMEESGQDILQANAESLSTLAVENPELAKTIMLRASNFGRASKCRRLG